MKLEIFKFEKNEIRTQVDSNGNPLFCVKDVCNGLFIGNSRDVTNSLDKNEIVKIKIKDSTNKLQFTSFVNVSGLKKIIFQSRRKVNDNFIEWVKNYLPKLDIEIDSILHNISIKKQPNKESNCTYIIKSLNTGLTKIGRSTDPNKRFEDLKRNRFDDTLIFLAYINKDLENILHSEFSEFRVKYEWFNLDSETINNILSKYNFIIN